jgi:hypothetical protein
MMIEAFEGLNWFFITEGGAGMHRLTAKSDKH